MLELAILELKLNKHFLTNQKKYDKLGKLCLFTILQALQANLTT